MRRRHHSFAVCFLGLVSLAVNGRAHGQPPSPGSPAPAAPFDRDLLIGIEDKAPIRGADENDYEYRSYNHVLTQASRTPSEALAAGARRDLNYAQLFEEPEKHRGQIVHLSGRLRRVRKFDAPARAAAEGVKTLYEGWIFDDLYLGNPYCVIFTELPKDGRIGEKLEGRATFDGYLFKRYRYRDAQGVHRDCPLLIGRTVVPVVEAPPVAESDWSFSRAFLPAFLSLVLGAGGLIVVLGWWYRLGDKSVRRRIDQRIGSAPLEMGADEETSPRAPGNNFLD